ncbi:bifunctional helix-turn-helix transcriptional regulator/GNAT family N-acetyltransferase [Actinacidiphila rubida]|uniref:Transcriptional regulator, MarR family with acetyltransferase activity n=1 Tax=Actinacidiphila rubida TaxID=310780 RepID=A0A1H8I5P1_9ACTN|nr:bifunctional helix-turn-helix transcriptional regulator/GNAT family N-acetyltransferase [Actinacidiphila rubida]SEN63396.1 transcriptional regulator, MarR family with acetyltransferase activity [Actinacidiphila rubida]
MAVKEIREFNRFYTNLIGALDYSRHLHTPFTLTEARVLYELAHSRHTDAADLRVELSLDAGHLSRMLAKFEQQELVTRGPSERDARRQRIELTSSGHEAASLLEERSEEAVGTLLGTLPREDRARLTDAMRTVREILHDDRHRGPLRPDVSLRAPRPGDLGWTIELNAAVYTRQFDWNDEYEALVARIVADYAAGHDPRTEAAWIAELDGERVGCVFCMRDEQPGAARLRLLVVDPAARGHGIGRMLVDACVAFAKDAGYRRLVLWTNDVLTDARRIYQRAGFELVAEKPHHSFGHDLVGQDWMLALDAASPGTDDRGTASAPDGDA